MKIFFTNLFFLISFLFINSIYAEDENLFGQPYEYDNSCGIRQILLAQQVLNGKNIPYEADIIEYWTIAHSIFDNDYSSVIASDPGKLSPEMLSPVPQNYSPEARKAVNGGPLTLASNLIKTGQGFLGLKATHVYTNKELAINQFGEFLFNAEYKLVKELGIDITFFDVSLEQKDFNKENCYFMLLINGCHWIGTNYNTTYNSLDQAPKPFDLNDVNSVPSIIIQWEVLKVDSGIF